MINSRISKIELSVEEEVLLKQIKFKDSHHQTLRESCQAAGKLSEMLLNRHAVPEIRIEYFTNPKYNIGTNKSRKEIFEGNGTKGSDIFYHGNFLKYLHYFIFGPDLPRDLIDEFFAEVDEGNLPSLARKLVRKYGLDSRVAAEEFYKLCLECDLAEEESRSVRDSVRRIS